MLLQDFVNKYFLKNSEGILGKIDKKLLSSLADLAIKGVGVWVNPLKKENL